MKQIFQRAAGSTFLRNNLIFLTGSTLVSFLNYLYYPVLGRLLDPSNFGEVQAIMSFFLQVGVFLQVLGLVIIATIKKYEVAEERTAIIRELEYLATSIGILGFVVTILATPWLQSFLRFSSPVPFVIFAIAAVLTIPLSVSNSYLQGFKRFAQLAWTNVVGAASKLVLSAVLVIMGRGTIGAVLGLAISTVINVIYTHFFAVRVGRPSLDLRPRIPDLRLVRPELRYAGLVFVASLCINVLLGIDIIAVKHYFSPHDAGLYAAISTVARIIFFLTGPLTAVLIASVKLGDPQHNRALLRRSLTMLLLLGVPTLAIFTLFPVEIMSLLLGSRYLRYAGQLPGLSLAIFLLSLANMLVFYHLMLRHNRVVVAAGLGLVSMVTLLILHHQTIPAVVKTLIDGSLLLLILIVVAVNWHPRPERRAS